MKQLVLADSFRKTRKLLIDGASFGFAWTGPLVVTLPVLYLLYDVLRHGISELSWSFLTEQSLDAGRSGGIASMIISTLFLLSICLLATVPLGLSTAIFLAELSDQGSRLGRLIRKSLDTLAGVPSIVFGLFGNAFFCLTLGMGYSLLAGGLTLACMVLPIFIRLAESGIRRVPKEDRHAAAALGLSSFTTLFRIVLPAASSTLVAALILGIGRAIAETAALIFTSGYVDRMPRTPLDSGRSLSIHIYDLALNVAGGNPRAYASAATLIVLLLLINGICLGLSRFASRHLQRDSLRGTML